MKKISLIGCGRWGTFLGWYAGNYCGFDQVDMYDIPTSPNFIELRDTRKNPYLSLSDNMILHDKIEDVLKNDIIIVSIGCQHFRSLCRQLNGFDVRGRTFLLAMKGLETPSARHYARHHERRNPAEHSYCRIGRTGTCSGLYEKGSILRGYRLL